MQTYIAQDGNWGTSPVVVLDLSEAEVELLADLDDDENGRWQMVNIYVSNRVDDAGFDMFSAHAALMSEQNT